MSAPLHAPSNLSAAERPDGSASAPLDRRWALSIGLGFLLLYLTTAPAAVNLDGLGYIKLLSKNFAAGHLLYMPLLRAATRLCHGDGLRAGRLLSALTAASGLVLFFGIARRAFRQAGWLAPDARFASAVAATGLGVSYGMWVEATDVEAYAPALLALLIVVRVLSGYQLRPSWPRALTVGLALGVAVLCHLTHVVLSVLVVGAMSMVSGRRTTRLLRAALALSVGGALALGVYAWAAFGVRHHDLAGAVAWVRTASHGFADAGGPYRIADALYGAAKSIIWSPYLYEADARRLLGQFALGLVPLAALGVGAWLFPHRLRGLSGTAALLWTVPYALLGLAFFASDSERWIFLLPVGWIAAAALLCRTLRRASACALVLLYIATLNFVTAIAPAHRDSWPIDRAERSSTLFADGDLVIFPGHAWDEYVALSSHAIVPLPLVYYVARDGVEAAFARVQQEEAAALAGGHRVWALRIYDEHDDDPRGMSELFQLGLDRPAIMERIGRGFVRNVLTAAPGVTVVQLTPIP